MADQPKYPEHPWRLDTNNRYRDAVKIVIDLSTASLVIPILFLRDILRIPKEQALSEVLTWKIYLAWMFFAIAIIAGFIFYYVSGKWVRLAWGQKAYWFQEFEATENSVERSLDISFGVAIFGFIVGIVFVLWFVIAFHPQ